MKIFIRLLYILVLTSIFHSCKQPNTTSGFYFPDDYVEQMRGTYSFEVPEVQELVHIIIALTPTGIKDKNMVRQDSEYHELVINYFEKFSDEPVIQKVDALLAQGKYNVLKMDACGYVFENGRIAKDGIYERLSWSGSNFAEPLVADLEDFAIKTNFRKFYKNNFAFYNDQINTLTEQISIKKQWIWLEKNFNISYDNYRITFSPLANASHATNNFIQDNFKQTVMFICGPMENVEFSNEVINGLMNRVVFTEIDHNYVNPISAVYRKEIDKSLNPIEKWANEDALENYNDSYSVFNEYMTWSVFCLYAKENFIKGDFKKINDIVETQMIERGFVKFREFNQMLMNLYATNNKSIETLYPEILNWFVI